MNVSEPSDDASLERKRFSFGYPGTNLEAMLIVQAAVGV